MKKFLSGVMATALAASFALASVIPVDAAPVMVPSMPATPANEVQQVRDVFIPNVGGFRTGNVVNNGNFERRMIRKRGMYRNRGIYRSGMYRNRDIYRDRSIYRDRDVNYRNWRGHRGYRHWRRGYREYDGWWYPLAAFAAGAVIAGAINEGPVYRSSGDAHERWCYNRYRSYRAYDNTFQPYNGPRQQCYSPYS